MGPGGALPAPGGNRTALGRNRLVAVTRNSTPVGSSFAASLLSWVFASITTNPQLLERSKSSFGVSVTGMALLYIAIAAANYAGHLFS